jgi:hypothetical protein
MIRYCPPTPPIYKRSRFRFKKPYSYYKKYITFDIFKPVCEPYIELPCPFPSMTILPLYLSMFITFCSCQSSFTIPLTLEQVWGDHISKIYFSSCNGDCKRYVVVPFYALPHDIQLTILTILHPYSSYYSYYPCGPCPENFKLWMAVLASAQIDFADTFFALYYASINMHFVLFCLSGYYQACDPFKNTKGILSMLTQGDPQIWTFVTETGWYNVWWWLRTECVFRSYFPSTDLYIQKTYDTYNHRLIVEVST